MSTVNCRPFGIIEDNTRCTKINEKYINNYILHKLDKLDSSVPLRVGFFCIEH